MATFEIQVDFVFSTTVTIEAADAASAQFMVENASNDDIAHLNGKSYAQAGDSVRIIQNVTEVT